MRKLIVAALCASGLALTGCGGSTCDKLADAAKELNEKAAACSEGTESEDLDTGECEEAYDELSDSEKEQVDELADELSECVSKLDTCEEGQENEWGQEAMGCLGGLSMGGDKTEG